MRQLTFEDLLGTGTPVDARGSAQQYLARVGRTYRLRRARAGIPESPLTPITRPDFPGFPGVLPSRRAPLVRGAARARARRERSRVNALRQAALDSLARANRPPAPRTGAAVPVEAAVNRMIANVAGGAAGAAGATEVAEAVTKTATKGVRRGLLARSLPLLAGTLGVELLLSLLPGTSENTVVRDQLGFSSGRSFREQLQRQIRANTEQMLFQTRMERMQQGIRANVDQLRLRHPELFLELAVGRKLPQGAVVFGGGTRPDYLEAVAHLMSEGAFEQGPPAEARLADLLDSTGGIPG